MRDYVETKGWVGMKDGKHVDTRPATAEPSRGAPPMTAGEVFEFCAEPDNSPEQCISVIKAYAQSERTVLLEALQRLTGAARSWHDFHNHPGTGIQCDAICEALPEAEAAIERAERP